MRRGKPLDSMAMKTSADSSRTSVLAAPRSWLSRPVASPTIEP
jgi:hypothetical protein